jgi:hypothetical protein
VRYELDFQERGAVLGDLALVEGEAKQREII